MSYLLGIDVGAFRTAAAVVRLPGGDVETVDLGDGDGVASVLHLGTDGTLHVGEAAEEWARTEPERVVSGFAQRIGEPSPPMLLAGEPWAPEELTAWLVRWVVDRVAEREGGAAAEIAVIHPVSWDDDRTRLLADALAEQDLDVTFVPAAQAVVVEHAGTGGPGSTLAVHDMGSGDVAVLRAAQDGALPAVLSKEAGVGVDLEELALTQLRAALPDTFPPDEDPALPSLRRAGAAAAEALGAGDRDAVPVPVPGDERTAWLHRDDLVTELRPRVEESVAALRSVVAAAGLAADDPAAVLLTGGAWTALVAEVVGEPSRPVRTGRDAAARGAALALHSVDDGGSGGIIADERGFTGGMGATNTAGLLSGYTPAHGMAAMWSEGPTAVTGGAADRPTWRPGAPGPAPSAAPAGTRRDPAVLVGLGGVAAAVAVLGTVFLWPAPRTTNSAAIRTLAPPVPVATAVEPAPTTAAPITTSVEPIPTRRPRPPAPVRTRRTIVAPPSEPLLVTTPPPSVSAEPTAPTTTSAPAETTPASTEPDETTAPPS